MTSIRLEELSCNKENIECNLSMQELHYIRGNGLGKLAWKAVKYGGKLALESYVGGKILDAGEKAFDAVTEGPEYDTSVPLNQYGIGPADIGVDVTGAASNFA